MACVPRCVDVCVETEQQPDTVQLVRPGGIVQRGAAQDVFNVWIGSFFEQGLRNRLPAEVAAKVKAAVHLVEVDDLATIASNLDGKREDDCAG